MSCMDETHTHTRYAVCVLISDSVYNTIYTKHYASGAALVIHGQRKHTHIHTLQCVLCSNHVYNS